MGDQRYPMAPASLRARLRAQDALNAAAAEAAQLDYEQEFPPPPPASTDDVLAAVQDVRDRLDGLDARMNGLAGQLRAVGVLLLAIFVAVLVTAR